MPILSKYQQPTFELLTWSITEPITFFKKQLQLSDHEMSILQEKFSHVHALQQWLASRLGLQTLFNTSYLNFKKGPTGKLELPHQTNQVSISHSGQYIAVAKSNQKVGIDLQIYSPKLERIAQKYIALELLNNLKKTPAYIDYLHIYWGIKEALFKAYGLGQVNFIEHLHIAPFEILNKGYTKAKIIKPDHQATYQVFYEKTANYYLCVVTKE